jgi:hypothetical protein
MFNLEDSDQFRYKLFYSGKLKPNVKYSILLKLRKGDIYYMIADKQESFIFNSYDDNSFIELYTFIRDRLQITFENYESELNFECDSVLLDFYPIFINNNLKLNNLNEARGILSDSSFKTARVGFNYFGPNLFEINGIPLDIKLSDGILNINGLSNDFDKFKEKILLNYISDTTVQEVNRDNKHYHINDNSKFYLINHQNRQFIIIVDIIDNNKVFKRCFNKFGDLITQATDTLLPNNNLKRESGNFTTILSRVDYPHRDRFFFLITTGNDQPPSEPYMQFSRHTALPLQVSTSL